METSNTKIIYPYMPENRQVSYVGIDNKFMARAKEVAHTSNEKQQPTGAVITCNDKIISEASNKNPLSSESLIKLHKSFCVRHFFKVKSGEMYWLCPGCAGKESHAESRAVKSLKNIPTEPVDIYLWGHWWCCDVCWNNMLKIPTLRNVYLLENSDILFNPKKEGNIIGKNS